MDKADNSLNMFNHWSGNGYSNTISPYIGVYRIPEIRKWVARITHEGLPTLHLGIFYTAEDAARAYDMISIKLYGWAAITNFDLSCYDVGDIRECEITQTREGTTILQKVGSNDKTEVDPQNMFLSQQHNPQLLINSTFSHGFKNPNLIPSNPYSSTLGGFMAGAGNSSNGNSIGNHGGKFPYPSATPLQQQSLQPQSQVNLKNVSYQNLLNFNNNNQFLPLISNFTNGAGSSSATLQQNLSQVKATNVFNQNIVNNNNNNQFLPPVSNFTDGAGSSSATLQRNLSQVNATNVFNQNIVNNNNNNNNQFLPPISNFTDGAGSSSATLQRNLSQVNATSVFNKNIVNNNNNNQLLTQISNFPLLSRRAKSADLERCLRLIDWRTEFGKKLLGGNLPLEPVSNVKVPSLTQGILNQSSGGAMNAGCSFGSLIEPVEPPNQEFGAIQLPFPEVNQTYEPHNFQANTLNQAPLQNLSSEANNDGNENDWDLRHYINILQDNDFSSDMFGGTNGGRQGQ